MVKNRQKWSETVKNGQKWSEMVKNFGDTLGDTLRDTGDTLGTQMTSVRINSKVSQENDSQHFHQIIELLLTDMKRFKQLVR